METRWHYNPGLDGPGVEVGEDWAPWSRREKLGQFVCLCPRSCPPGGLYVRLPALRPSVPVAKGEATSETKVSEKERRFPVPAGAVSSSPSLPGLGVSSGRASGPHPAP